VLTAARPIVPTVAITGPSIIGPCDALPLDISSSTGSGGRSWASVVFEVSGSTVNASKIKSFLDAQTNFNKAITIPKSLFDSGNSYNIKVNLCNFLGQCGRDALPFIVSASANVPVVVMNSDKLTSVGRSNRLSISGDAYTTQCSGGTSKAQLTYTWKIYQNNNLLTADKFKSTSVNPKVFILPAYTLDTNAVYVVTLTVQHDVSLKYSSVSTTVVVQPGAVVAKLKGGTTMNMRVTGTATIDASDSYDMDNDANTGAAAGLTFVFLCHKIAPTYNDNCGLTTSASNGVLTVSVPGAADSFIDTQHEIVVQVIHGTDKRTDSVTVQLTIIPSLGALVSVKSENGIRINNDQKLTITGTVQYQSGGNALWSVSDSSIDLSAASPVSSALVASGGTVTKVMSMVVLASTLSQGSEYTFRLDASITGGDTFGASVTVTTNQPPVPGTLTIDPTTGQEFDTQFQVIATQWEDDDLPISFEFSHGASGDGFVVFRSRKQVAHTNSKLPAGTAANNAFDVRVQVFDVLDGKSNMDVSVTVTSAQVSNDDVANDLADSLNGDSSDVKESTSLANQIVNSVGCTNAPDCDALNRKKCSRVKDTCGKCKDLFEGVSGHDNSYCAAANNGGNRRLQSKTLATSCSSNSDCNQNAFETCSSGTCSVPQKVCVDSCSSSAAGTCKLVYVHDPTVTFTSCKLTDTHCEAKCECKAGYAGSYCQYTTAELASVQSVRTLLIQGYQTLMETENPARDTFLSWLAGLSTVSVDAEGLTDAARELLITLAADLMDVANTLGLPYEDLDGMEKILELTMSLYFDQAPNRRQLATYANSLSLMEQLRTYAYSDMAPGQNPITLITPHFRFAVTSLDGISAGTASSPLSAVEIAAGTNAQQVFVPAHPSHNPMKVVLTEIAQDTLSSSFDPMVQSVPLDVLYETHLCNGTVCYLNITLQNFVFGAAVSPEQRTRVTECYDGIQANHSYWCPSGVNVTTYCNGTYDGNIISECPVHVPTSYCDSIGDYVGQCTVSSFDEDTTTCMCTLPPDGSSLSSKYQSYASSELQFYPDSYSDRESDGTDAIIWIVFIMVMSLFGFGAFEMYKRYQAKSSGAKSASSSRAIGNAGESWELTLVDSAMPYILQTGSFGARFLDELRSHHQWFACLWQKSDTYPRALNLISLLTKIIVVYLLEAILYNFVDRNESFCNDDLDKSSCQSKKSWIALGNPMCDWNINSEGDGVCRFHEPDDDAMRTLFLAVLISLLVVPFWMPLDYAMKNILGTPECCGSSSAAVAVTNDEEAQPTISRQRSARYTQDASALLGSSLDTDYNGLIQGARNHASTLSGEQQTKFRAAWYLYDDDSENVVIRSELENARATVVRENEFMESPDVSPADKSKRLFSLFVSDFLAGSNNAVLQNKMQRDRKPIVQTPVNQRRMGWAFIACMNIGALVYIFLFWSRQSRERQFAFFVTFMLWLLLDVFFITMGVFFWTHVVMPSWVRSEVRKSKRKVMQQLLESKQSNGAVPHSDGFNSAKQLFTSVRVASMVPGIPESAAVLSFATQWPRHCALSGQGGEIASKGFVVDSCDSLVNSLAGMSFFKHDLMVTFLISVFVAGLSILHVVLFRIDEGYALIPVCCLMGLFLLYLVCSRAGRPASVYTEEFEPPGATAGGAGLTAFTVPPAQEAK
jgi:hypothetical protein